MPWGYQTPDDHGPFGFLPGEPFRLKVTLEASEGATRYLGETSLDPDLGYLELWIYDEGAPCKMAPLDFPWYTNADLKPRPFPSGETESEGIDAWFPLSFLLPVGAESCSAGEEKTYRFLATYSGLRGENGNPAAEVSRVFEMTQRRPTSQERLACELQVEDPEAHRQARWFLYLRGGDHLVEGRKLLRKLARRYEQTTYGLHANLVLGESLARSFLGYRGEKKGLVERGPRPGKAARYLSRVEPEQLPPSYLRGYLEALAQIEEVRGAGSRRPRTARRHYERALEFRRDLAPLPRPLGLSQEEWDEKRSEAEETLIARLEALNRL